MNGICRGNSEEFHKGSWTYMEFLISLNVVCAELLAVPDHDGGRPIEVNACILITHMVYL